MSKSIWHTADERPKEERYYLEEYKKFSYEIGYLVNKQYGNVNTIDDLTTKKWCYLDDLLALETELERTRKALDVLLLTINRLENQNYKDCAWHLRLAMAKIKATGIANKALEQITAEQKDVK